MNDARLRFRSLALALVVLAITSLSARAQENTSAFLSDLHSFRISNYMALDAFYRFSATGSTDTLNEIVAGINAANDAMNAVSASTGGVLSKDQIESLNQEFDKFKSLMRENINVVRKEGYPDLRLVSDMANQAVAMSNKATDLYKVAQDSTQTDTNDRVEAARMAAVKMAQMMAKYSARTNSSVAQTFQGSSSEKPLDEQARDFDALFATVRNGPAQGELKDQLDNISTKWQFIRGSYVNYNENNVSFVIDRYSKGILKHLAKTIELLQKGNS